jgi:hypothetical protein
MEPYQYWRKIIHIPAETEALAGIGINVTEIGRFVNKIVFKKFQVTTIPYPI